VNSARHRSWPLRLSLPLALFVLLVPGLLGVDLWHYVDHRQQEWQDEIARLTERVGLLRTGIAPVLARGDLTTAQMQVRDLARQRNLEHALLVDGDGRIVLSSQVVWLGKRLDQVAPEIARALPREPREGSFRGRDEDRVVVWAPLDQPRGWLLMTYDLGPMLARHDRESLISMAINAALVGLFALLLWLWLNRAVNRPLQDLMRAARQVARGDYQLDLSLSGSAEFHQLGEDFSAMARELAHQREELLASREAYREQEAHFRALFEHAGDAILISCNQVCVDCNPRALALFGCATREQLLGRSPADYSPPTQPDGRDSKLTSCDLAAAAALAPQSFPWRHLRFDGGAFDAEVTINQIHHGDQVLIQSMIRDVSERRRDETELRKLSLAVEQSPSAVVITDDQANIEYVNPAFVAISGYRAEEVIGRNPRMLSSGQVDRATYEALWHNLKQGLAWQGEFINRRKDGVLYTESVWISPVRQADGRVSNYLAIKEDISERKRMLAELELARDGAEQANRSKSEFLANMSHEIRTPMNAITGMAELALATELSPKQRNYVSKIKIASEALLRIINDILDFSKIEAGKLSMEHIEFRLDSVLDNLGALLAERAEAKGIELLYDIAPELDGASRPAGGELPDLPGIDRAAGLAQVNGNAALYRKVLVKFRDQHAVRF
jgi:PAS domain S-box-containing protein